MVMDNRARTRSEADLKTWVSTGTSFGLIGHGVDDIENLLEYRRSQWRRVRKQHARQPDLGLGIRPSERQHQPDCFGGRQRVLPNQVLKRWTLGILQGLGEVPGAGTVVDLREGSQRRHRKAIWFVLTQLAERTRC